MIKYPYQIQVAWHEDCCALFALQIKELIINKPEDIPIEGQYNRQLAITCIDYFDSTDLIQNFQDLKNKYPIFNKGERCNNLMHHFLTRDDYFPSIQQAFNLNYYAVDYLVAYTGKLKAEQHFKRNRFFYQRLVQGDYPNGELNAVRRSAYCTDCPGIPILFYWLKGSDNIHNDHIKKLSNLINDWKNINQPKPIIKAFLTGLNSIFINESNEHQY